MGIEKANVHFVFAIKYPILILQITLFTHDFFNECVLEYSNRRLIMKNNENMMDLVAIESLLSET